jgi:hypothetical protein
MIDDTLPVTSGSEWLKNREEGELVQLPYSGRLVRVRTVRPDMLLRQGKIPNPLATLMVNMIYSKGGELDAFLNDQENIDAAMEMLESLRVVCTAGLVAPRIVDDPVGDDEISIDDIELPDRSFIFRLVFVRADALKNFRYKPPTDVEIVANGAGDPQPAL